MPSEEHRRGTRIAHIGIAVRALDDLLPFYRDVLQLPDVPLDDADRAHIAGFAAGESLIELLEAEVDDLTRSVQALQDENAFLQRLFEDPAQRASLPPPQRP